ncbi:MAG: hypothetical protein F9K51_02330, partial [Candidatus Dadabacteria bacterium]
MNNLSNFYNSLVLSFFIIMSAFILVPNISLAAQEITGVPGSPDATRTIDGKQLPAPPLPFGGEIKENASQSKP